MITLVVEIKDDDNRSNYDNANNKNQEQYDSNHCIHTIVLLLSIYYYL